jgi:hypothetical protein
MTDAASPYSAANPKLQRAWDATSLKALMSCARFYQYSILEGWRPNVEGDDLTFGRLFAGATETYARGRLNALSKHDATKEALRYALAESYDSEEQKPWSGHYAEQWHCLGTEKYKNKKGNAAKCPYAHKGVWFDAPGPSVCGECGSPTEHADNWISINPAKDRYSLIRLVAWYCDDQPEQASDAGLYPFAFEDGTPAVELSFRFPLSIKTPTGEPYLLCGHMDKIVSYSSELFISDNKTTKKTLSQSYWKQYSPNIQVDLYDLAGSVLFPSLDLHGVLIEGAQTLVNGASFGLHPEHRTETMRRETLENIEWWIGQAERYATDNYWPMNKASCYLCQFKGICGAEPQMREGYLKANFTKRFWNPLEER